jgi:hypothetical protein
VKFGVLCINAKTSCIFLTIGLLSPNSAFHRENKSWVEETQTPDDRIKCSRSHQDGIFAMHNAELRGERFVPGLFN